MPVLSLINFLILFDNKMPLTLNCHSSFFDCLAMCKATNSNRVSPLEEISVSPLSCAMRDVHSCAIEHIAPDQEKSQSNLTAESERCGRKGRKRSAVEITANAYFTNVEGAQKIMDKYIFPLSGEHDATSWAMSVESCGKRPPWDQKYLKERQEQRAVSDPHIELGAKISEGAHGTVYEDSAASSYVIKEFKGWSHGYHPSINLRTAEEEAALFNTYYGPGAACVIPKFFKTYLRMYKVPGENIERLAPGALPGDAVERFVDMLERMQNVGILHADLHCGNFVYDADSEQFHPFDFSNLRRRFFDADPCVKEEYNRSGTFAWNNALATIRGIKKDSPEELAILGNKPLDTRERQLARSGLSIDDISRIRMQGDLTA